MHPRQDYFWKGFFLYGRLIRYANYMHFYVGEILFLQKAGVTNLPPPLPVRGISPMRFRKRSEINRDNLL
jgi:hypothetical protein